MMAPLYRWSALVIMALAASCGGGSGSGVDPAAVSGSAQMPRAVAPGCSYDHVYVTVEKVVIDQASGLKEVVLPSPRRIDLMGLKGGVLTALGTASLPAGHYTGVRLVLAENGESGSTMANAVVPTGGGAMPLTTPSAQQSGLKLQADFDVAHGQSVDLLLNFDPCQSVTRAGNSGRDLLSPVLAAQPIDVSLIAKGEFRVNTTTAGDQSAPVIATLANGGYVIAWMSSTGIYSQRYDHRGAQQGGETLVSHNTSTDEQLYPRLAGLNDGGYVVVWRSRNSVDFRQVIYAQRFDAAGAAVDGATRVSPESTLLAITPSVAGLADGGFLVTWSTELVSIDAQRYDRNGGPLGGATRVSLTPGDAWQSAVTALSDGGYAAAWGAIPIDVHAPEVYTRRFDAAGLPVGAETRANTFTADAQQSPAIAALQGGDYVVTWMSQYQDGSGYGIYAQRYGSSGAPVGSEIQANTVTSGSQEGPAIAGLADGGYVVVWFHGDIRAQRFDSTGAPVGAEARVNTAARPSAYPSITALPNGGYVVAWQSWTEDGSGGYDIYAQQFDAQGSPR